MGSVSAGQTQDDCDGNTGGQAHGQEPSGLWKGKQSHSKHANGKDQSHGAFNGNLVHRYAGMDHCLSSFEVSLLRPWLVKRTFFANLLQTAFPPAPWYWVSLSVVAAGSPRHRSNEFNDRRQRPDRIGTGSAASTSRWRCTARLIVDPIVEHTYTPK